MGPFFITGQTNVSWTSSESRAKWDPLAWVISPSLLQSATMRASPSTLDYSIKWIQSFGLARAYENCNHFVVDYWLPIDYTGLRWLLWRTGRAAGGDTAYLQSARIDATMVFVG